MSQKKARIPHHQPHLGQADQYNTRLLQRIVDRELHKLASPVEHIDPATLTEAYVNDLISRADPLHHHTPR